MVNYLCNIIFVLQTLICLNEKHFIIVGEPE